MRRERESKIALRLRWPLVGLVFLLCAAVLIPHRIWNTLLIGLGGLFVVAAVWTREMKHKLSAARRLRFGWMAVGDRLSERFEIHNASWLPALWVEIEDDSNVPGYRARVVQSVSPNSSIQWRQAAVCRQRGQFRLGPWRLITSDPFGIFEVVIVYPSSEEIVIHPPIHTQLPVPLPAGQRSGRVRARQKAWQATINAAGVRDYQPQDPQRWIHWPTSARRDALFVREFDLDAAGDVWLVLDLHAQVQLGEGIDGTEEHMVLWAASLAAEALRRQRGVGLAAYGQTPQIILPQRGQGQQWRILQALALVRARGRAPLATALDDLKRIAHRGAAAVIMTPNLDAAWLPKLPALAGAGIQPSVVLLDRATFGGEGNTQALQKLITHMGYAAHILQQGEIGRPAVEAEQRGFWEFQVTPLGGVVVTKRPGE